VGLDVGSLERQRQAVEADEGEHGEVEPLFGAEPGAALAHPVLGGEHVEAVVRALAEPAARVPLLEPAAQLFAETTQSTRVLT